MRSLVPLRLRCPKLRQRDGLFLTPCRRVKQVDAANTLVMSWAWHRRWACLSTKHHVACRVSRRLNHFNGGIARRTANSSPV
mmetsp:Transcript_88100/g.252513  ORF Transcript_88100/g.252513 Transcript_88100/m.252513 type:complete len:82 (-) Transcript_88100:1973-2218(-)